MQTGYVVMGEQGEYAEQTTWVVRVFASKAKAEEHLQKLQDWQNHVIVALVERLKEVNESQARAELAPTWETELDPHMQLGAWPHPGNPTYEIQECDLEIGE